MTELSRDQRVLVALIKARNFASQQTERDQTILELMGEIEAELRKAGNPNHKGGGPGGGQFTSGGGGGGTGQHGKHWAKRQRKKKRKAKGKRIDKSKLSDRERKGKPKVLSDKAKKAQDNQTRTTKEHQNYAKENEFNFAKRIGGKAFADNGPVDVETKAGGKTHGIELKTVTHGKNDKLTMKGEALARKTEYATAGNELHTVALDHRDKFGQTPELHSGHEIYYKRGAGSFRLSSMHKVKDVAELHTLMKTPLDKLPAKAR